MITKLKHALKTDRGVLVSLKQNTIIVGPIPDDVAEFETPAEAKDYISTRRIAVLKAKDMKDETGALDEIKVASHYVDYYARLESIAIPWELGLVLTKNQPEPISYAGKLYECIQGITVNDPNHTPDVVPAHYTEIQAPSASGYPEWVQPTGSHDAYMMGDRMTYTDGLNYESLIDDNVWSPEEYAQGWVVLK